LLQQRSKTKLIYPLLWDVSVAGHIEAGETITAGALREIKEEIGLNLKENHLTKVGVFESFKNYGNGCIDNEFHHTFTAVLTVDVDDLKPQAEEVEDLKLVTIAEFETLLQNSEHNGHFVATNDAYYLKILQSIKQYVN
jgi:isopentenyldiphosphate isomerase